MQQYLYCIAQLEHAVQDSDNEHIIEGKQSLPQCRSHDCHTHYSPHPTSSSPSLQSTSPSHIHAVGTHRLEAGQKDSLSGLHRMSACTERQANEISTGLVKLALSHRFLHTKTAIYKVITTNLTSQQLKKNYRSKLESML